MNPVLQPNVPAPAVSVVISAYNRPDLLAFAIESALAQTVAPLEIIVVDDASPTPLAPLTEKYGERITMIREDVNGGACRARNRGIAAARGDFIAFLDDDDVWLPQKLQRQMEAIGDRAACLCGFRRLETGIERVRHDLTRVDEAELRRGNQVCGTSGLLARRDVLRETLFDEALPNGQDWDVYVRLLKHGPLVYVAEPLYDFRLGDHRRITHKMRSARPADLARQLAATDKHRTWLGEPAYRRRVAATALAFLGDKSDKLGFLRYALTHAGPVATLEYLTAGLHRTLWGRRRAPIPGARPSAPN